MTGIEVAILAAVAIGGIVSAVGQYSSAQAQAKGKAYEAKIKDRNARIARSQAQADAEDVRRDTRRRLATIRAAYGSKGFSLAGSAIDVLEDQSAEGELAAQRVSYKGEIAATQQEDEAKLSRFESKSLRRSATIGLIGSGFETAGSVGSSAYMMGLV